MEFRILGPLEVVGPEGPVALGGAKRRGLLAYLLVHVGEAVSADRLADDLWDQRPSSGARGTVQSYLSGFRKLLADDDAASLETHPSGYVLTVPAACLDAARFERLCVRAASEAEAAKRLECADEALGLWRSTPLAEFAGSVWADVEATRLGAMRVQALQGRVDALLALGRHAQAIPELEALVGEHRLDERFWAQLLVAYYRAGKQGDALRAYRRARSILADELGIEPGAELVELERRVLDHDPALMSSAGSGADLSPSASHTLAAQRLPSGVVTFLLSDIVGSTSLWEQHPKAMAEAVRRHEELMHGAVVAHGGTVLKARGEGDSTFSVFARATDALAAALSAQRVLLNEGWPESAPLSVRMALHTGEAFERDGDYYGPTVNRAARIRSLAAGGQVLVSQSTGELVRDDLPEQAALIDLGSNVLSELSRAERISGLAAPGLPELETLGAETFASPAGVSLPVPGVLRDAAADLFVGRERELETLARAWEDASVGDRRAVLIGGEPGVGKTRLAAELAGVVAAEGSSVLYGRCDEELGIPYQPWVEALRHLIVHEPRPLLAEHVARYGRELARLIPELAQRVGDLPRARPVDPDAERYRLFGAVVGLLARVCGDIPVLLVLEDLHWADKPSLLLLRHVIASTDPRRLLVVGTYRPTDLGADHPLADVLAALHREERVQRVDLRGLDDTEVVALVEAGAGQTLDDNGVALAHALYRETDGNPFFTREILRHLAETGAIYQRDDGRWISEVDLRDQARLPTSVREVIGRRVARLGEELEQTLRVAAVIGRDFELDLLAGVTDQSEDRLLDLLDGAIRAVLIGEVPDQPGRLSFAHALIEHTLYDGLGPTRRQRLHRRVAATLETLCSDDPGDRLGELAYHWAQASEPTDAAKAIAYALRAGDHALAKLAPDDAVTWYGQALDLLDRQSAADEVARCETLIGLGTAQRQAGDPRSRDTLLGAADLAQRLGSRALLVRAALENNLGGPTIVGATDQARVDALEAALAATAGTETPERAMLLATLALEVTWGDPKRARTLSDEALGMARRVHDDQTLWDVLEKRPFAIWSPATLDERTANAHEQREVAERLGDETLRFGTALNLVYAANCRGDMAEVDDNLDMLIGAATETGFVLWRTLAMTLLSSRQLLAGRIEDAEQAAGEALQIASQTRDANAYLSYTSAVYEIRRAQGRLGEIIEFLERAVADNPRLPVSRAVLAEALCELDRLDDARVVFEPLVANGFTDFPFDFAWLTAMASCAGAAASLEHRAATPVLAELLAPWRDQVIYTTSTCTGSVARPLGLALATAGRLDEADEAFAQALAVHERIDAPIELARTQVDWARMLASRARPGDLDRARPLLESALTTATNLGLATIRRHGETLLARIAAE